MAFEIIAVVTNEAKGRLAEMLATGKSFKVTYFSVGDQGHDPSDPTIALAPDPSDTVCNKGQPVLFGPEPIDGYSYTGTFCPTFMCVVEEGEAVGVISTICLIATIVYSPTPGDPEVGQTFVFAIANMPFWAKTDLDSRTWYISTQF